MSWQFTIPGLDLRYYRNAADGYVIWSLRLPLLIPVVLLFVLAVWFRRRLKRLRNAREHGPPAGEASLVLRGTRPGSRLGFLTACGVELLARGRGPAAFAGRGRGPRRAPPVALGIGGMDGPLEPGRQPASPSKAAAERIRRTSGTHHGSSPGSKDRVGDGIAVVGCGDARSRAQYASAERTS